MSEPAAMPRKGSKTSANPRPRTLRIYYAGSIAIASIRCFYDEEGQNQRLALVTDEGSHPVASLEEADRIVLERLRGEPRALPLRPDQIPTGYHVRFHLEPGVTVKPMAEDPE